MRLFKIKTVWFLMTVLSLQLLLNASYASSAKTAGEDTYFTLSDTPASHEDENNTKGHEEVEGSIKLSTAQQQAAGIHTIILQKKSLQRYVSAPGDVLSDPAFSAAVTTKIVAQVVKQYVFNGDEVHEKQPIVMLSSVEMAEAEHTFLLAAQEWNMMREFKQKEVFTKQRIESAKISFESAYAKLISYGMDPSEVEQLQKSRSLKLATGSFTLLAPKKGTIVKTGFIEGEVVKPGRILYQINNDAFLWVNARLSPDLTEQIKPGAAAIVTKGKYKLEGKVENIHHVLDKETRTQVVRIRVANPHDRLHPGDFVDCKIHVEQTASSLAIPNDAIMQDDNGQWIVYVEVKPNYFKAQKVKIIEKVGPWQIAEGVEPGERIVSKGAFFVHSESLKGGFSTHNH